MKNVTFGDLKLAYFMVYMSSFEDKFLTLKIQPQLMHRPLTQCAQCWKPRVGLCESCYAGRLPGS